MQTQPNYHQYMDFGGAFGLVEENLPLDRLRRDDVLPDFAVHGIVGFGGYSPIMGCMTGAQLPTVMAEYDDTDEIGDTGFVLTKHFEMDPADYAHVARYGQPKNGSMALASDGEVYEWQSDPEGLGGFFKKLIKKAKKIGKKIKSKVKKFVKRLPLGKQLWKIGSKIHDTAMKITKTLLKKIGPIAKRIAPIAALVPGIGPAVSGALMLTGKVYDVAKKFGVKFDAKKRPIITSRRQGGAFARALAAEGKNMGKSRANRVIDAYKRIQRRKGGLSGESAGGDTEQLYYRMPQNSGMGWV